MKRWMLIVCLIFAIGCTTEKAPEEIIYFDPITSEYLCEDYALDDNSSYYMGSKLRYKLQIIQLKSDPEETRVNPMNVISHINERLNPYGYDFIYGGIDVQVVPEFRRNSVRYKGLLKRHWKRAGYGFVTIIVVPDFVEIAEGINIGGAAFGVPRTHNPSAGKPILFVKRKNLLNNIVIHELGHVFSLLHIFHRNDYNDPGHGCHIYDRVSDTPTPTVGHGITVESCRYVPGLNDTLTPEERRAVVRNYMSYADSHCMNEFTVGQVNRAKYMSSIHPLLQAAEYKEEFDTLFEPLRSAYDE